MGTVSEPLPATVSLVRPSGLAQTSCDPRCRSLIHPAAMSARRTWRYVLGTYLAYVKLHDDERAETVTGFVERALAFFCSHGISTKRLMTDNAFTYVNNRSLRQLLEDQGISHLRTKPYRPQTNGKIERFHQTMAGEWAYGMTYASARARARALPYWMSHYNERRPHSALAGKAPITRVRSGTSVGTTARP